MQDRLQDFLESLTAWIPALVIVIPTFWFMFRSSKILTRTRRENAEFRQQTSQFWDKTLALQAESNQLTRELIAELRSRR